MAVSLALPGWLFRFGSVPPWPLHSPLVASSLYIECFLPSRCLQPKGPTTFFLSTLRLSAAICCLVSSCRCLCLHCSPELVEGGGNIARASSSWQWPSVCKGLMKKFYFPPMCRVLFGLQWGPLWKDTCVEVTQRAGEGLRQGPAQDRQGRLSCVFWKSFIAHLSLLNRAGYQSKALCSSWKILKYKRTLTNLSLAISYLSWELIEHTVTGWYGKFCVMHL